ncbi:MAG: DUF4340 domain-containing protein, partial [Myxococcota bacterium]
MIRRLRGALIALIALVVVAAIAVWSERGPSRLPDRAVPDTIFRFEKDDLVGFVIERPTDRIAIRQVDGVWRVDGQPWRPNRSMIRRVAHQLHDLDARADVVDVPADPAALAQYGLGDGAIRVELSLADGRTLAFEVGDPNPTSVSWYLRLVPSGRVYVVKKAAMDLFRLDSAAFREDRIALFDADDATAIDATIDGAHLLVEQTGARTYRMRAPVDQPASRDRVRAMLGRVASLRALDYPADHPRPEQLAAWSLAPPLHRIAIHLGSGDALELSLGATADAGGVGARYVYLAQDDAVYLVKDGLLEAFQLGPDELRDRELVGRHAWDVVSFDVDHLGRSVTIRRTSDGVRWPDDAPVAGSTPERLAGRAAELRAIAFHDQEPPDTGLASPWATVRLAFAD